MSDDRPKKDDPESFRPKALPASTQEVIIPEIVEAIRGREAGTVNVNVLLVEMVQRVPADEIVSETEKILALAQKFEDHRVQNFKRTAEAIIEVKTKDPDEIEKRRNNRTRRALKGVVGSGAVLGIGGTVACVLLGAPIVVTGVVGSLGVLGLALSATLASGESVSSTDIIRVIQAIPWPGGKQRGEEENQPDRPQRGGARRKR